MSDYANLTDRQPVPGARFTDLDLNQVQRHIAVAKERGRYDGPVEPLEYLRLHHGVVDIDGAPVPTIAGVLVFAPAPERFLSSGIDIAQFTGPTPRSTGLRFMEQVRGPLAVAIDRTVQILWIRSEHGYRLEGAQRIEEHAYPEVVLRELTVNALCHRDWSQDGSRVRIQMLPNCIEWISPGSLPPGVTLQNLRTAQVSRNRVLAQMLFHAGYVEEFGIGIDTVFDTLRDAKHEPPWLQDDGHFFTFRVLGKPIDAGATAPSLPPVDKRKASIIAMIEQQGPLTVSELQAQLSISRRTLQRNLQELVEQGYLHSTGATNNLRYYLGTPRNS
jgi:ATP-dependent DNA helicase RecG